MIEPTVKHWYCPNCDFTVESRDFFITPRLHPCQIRGGMYAPLVEVGIAAKVEVFERQDYEGTDLAQKDGNGRPIYLIQTTRDEGTDAIVLAPTATAKAG